MKNKSLDQLLNHEYRGKARFPLIPAVAFLLLALVVGLWQIAHIQILKNDAVYKATADLRSPPHRLVLAKQTPTLHMIPLKAKGTSKQADFNAMLLNETANFTPYTYIFEGTAIHKRKPCDKASVLVYVSTPHQTQTKGAITDENGHFRIEVTVNTGNNDPVDYAMEAYTQDFQKVELAGRRIVTQAESPMTIAGPFAFLPQ